ncbi:DapH/DapD/GlmU-related protein [Chloroflexota bacterium]
MYQQSRISKNVIFCGEVSLGKDSVVEDNVILGHRADGVVNIGDNALIRSGSVIYSGVKIGQNFRTGHNILLRENTVIGDSVLIGTNSVVENNCKIGNDVSVQTGVYVTTNTTIENDVFMGPHSVTTNDKYMRVGAKLVGPTIKKGARIGANAVLLPGIVVGEEAVVGSGAVVTKDVLAETTVVGNPAREIHRKRI